MRTLIFKFYSQQNIGSAMRSAGTKYLQHFEQRLEHLYYIHVYLYNADLYITSLAVRSKYINNYLFYYFSYIAL